MARQIRAMRGATLRCKGWRQESLLRMLENVLEVGERPEDLVVYTAGARAARNWDSFDRIVRALQGMEEGQTLVIQSGKPIGLFTTYPDAPIVVMANANLVGYRNQWIDSVHAGGNIEAINASGVAVK